MADAVGLFTLYGLAAAVILVIWFVYAIGRFVWSRVARPRSARPRIHGQARRKRANAAQQMDKNVDNGGAGMKK
jgi:hypothetical protein